MWYIDTDQWIHSFGNLFLARVIVLVIVLVLVFVSYIFFYCSCSCFDRDSLLLAT